MIKKLRRILIYFLVVLNMTPALYASQPIVVNNTDHDMCAVMESSMDSMMNSYFFHQNVEQQKHVAHTKNKGSECTLSCDSTSNKANRVYNVLLRPQPPLILISSVIPIAEYLCLDLSEINSINLKPPNESITLIDYQSIKLNC